MKFKISCVFLVVVLGLTIVSTAAAAPSSWQVGSYWTYQELLQVQSSSLIPARTVTYYVVARTDLLYAAMCAVVSIDKSPTGKTMAVSPLTIHVSDLGTLRPQVWPFPAPGTPITVVKMKGTMLGEGGSQMTKTTSPQGKGKSVQQFSILQGKAEKVTVPAGVFPNAIRFEYQEKVIVPANIFPSSHQNPGQYSGQAEGTAWWSNKVAGWVRIEGHSQGSHPGGYADTASTLALSNWGRLSEKDLKEQLSTALTDIASVNPVMAVMITQQFQEVGFDLKN